MAQFKFQNAIYMSEQDNIKRNIEALLFAAGEPLSFERLASLLNINGEQAEEAVQELADELAERGIRVVVKGKEVILATSPDCAEVVSVFKKEEVSGELSKAALETLAIVTYKAPITRAEIDFIRGVNSTFTLRNLLVRGLVERKQNPDDSRSYIYSPSFGLLRLLGISRLDELPEYSSFRNSMEKFIKENQQEDE